MQKKENKIETEKDYKYSKKQFMKHCKYSKNIDALEVLLKEDNYYTKKEVNDLLNNFYGGDIK